MVLTAEIQKSITDFVYKKPRTVQEIAHLISKNWRTANSYVDKINQEQGTLSSRTFREGTRGALKIVFWNNLEKISSTEFQDRLFKKIEAGKSKSDFSPFDIYQYVEAKKRRAFLEEQEDEVEENEEDNDNEEVEDEDDKDSDNDNSGKGSSNSGSDSDDEENE